MDVKVMYEDAVADLKKFCNEATGFELTILSDDYPLQIHFIPTPTQTSFFDTELVDENGEVTDAEQIITPCPPILGVSTVVRSSLNFRLDGATLKKLISKAEKVGAAYLHYFRSAAGNLADGPICYPAAAEPDAEEREESKRLDGSEPLKLLEA